ncbi:80 kd MCM3-associated protein [Plectosphaerella plurivora]|uniref:80 kd MCM3-associated protein n=1 Tax=Plectosphaerella plurivora TaxID=936078 RepID=A0A9P8VA22_9PEZI|nr:80 kd MCM3-associated protein [Plectosphaerella plurivora]
MPSKASSSSVCRRQRRRPNHSQRRPPAREPAEPGSLSLDGAGDSRWLKRKQKNAMSGRQTKQRRGASPFDGALSDDNRRQKNNGAADRKKPTASSAQSIVANGKDFKSKKFAAGAGAARPNSVTYEVDENAYPTGPLLPFATSIYDQLRSDGIYPPKWPNSLSNTVAMGKLREDHKVYRDRARDSLIRANLVDAPGVQKRLEDALVFKGVCENMCPEMEMITRIIEPDIPSVEKDPATSFVERRKMIKKLARSAAGQETPLPMDVLSVASMRRTLNYLIDNLLRTDENLPVVHGYLWDRTRALRRDFTFHSEMCAEELTDQVYCYENIIRFHVTALHLLSRKSVRPEEFSEQQELEQLSKTLMSLMSAYETCEAKNVICENESEFRAYYGLFFASSPDIQSSFQRGARSLQAWKDSDVIRTAVSLIEALQNTSSKHGPLGNSPSHAALGMHSVYFRILESPEVSYTMACFAEIHFGTLRRSILQQAKKAYRRPKILSKDPTPALLNSFLRFDTDEEAVEFIEMHGLDFLPNEDAPHDPSRRYLDVTKLIGQPRIHHAYSSSLVEMKRGNRSLPTVIHETTFEDPSAPAAKFSDEESLFVSDNAGHNYPSGNHALQLRTPTSHTAKTDPSPSLDIGIQRNRHSHRQLEPFKSFAFRKPPSRLIFRSPVDTTQQQPILLRPKLSGHGHAPVDNSKSVRPTLETSSKPQPLRPANSESQPIQSTSHFHPVVRLWRPSSDESV